MHALDARLPLACLLAVAICCGKSSDEPRREPHRRADERARRDGAPRPDARPPEKPTGRAPGKSSDAGTRPRPDARPGPPAGPPTGCEVAGEPVEISTSGRVLGEASIAQVDERTCLAWTDGPIAKVVVVDRHGRPVAPETELNAARTNAQDLTVLGAGGAGAGFFVVYKHKYGTALEGCDLVGRKVEASGAVGEAVVLASDVCAAGYPVYRAAVRERTLMVAHTRGYEGRGVEVVRWAMGGAPFPASAPGTEDGSAVELLAPTSEGLVLVWRVDLMHSKFVLQKLDPAGVPAGRPERLRAGPRPRLVWDGTCLWDWALVAGGLQVRPVPLGEARGRWRDVDLGARARNANVRFTGGRLWAVLALATGGFRAVALDSEGGTAGAPIEVVGPILAVDGRNGSAAFVRDSPRALLWQALSCASSG